MSFDATRAASLADAHERMKSSSVRARRKAVTTIAALGGADAYEPLISALGDPDRRVRFTATLGLADRDDPARYTDQIASALIAAVASDTGPDAALATEIVDMHVAPGVVTRLGLAPRVMAGLPHVAREGRRRNRRRAELLLRALLARTQPER